MLEVLTSIPSYSPIHFSGLTKQEYENIVAELRREVNRAIELFEAYWKTSNTRLFDISREHLDKAFMYMTTLKRNISNYPMLDKMTNRAEFTYLLAGAMLGGKAK